MGLVLSNVSEMHALYMPLRFTAEGPFNVGFGKLREEDSRNSRTVAHHVHGSSSVL